MTTAGQKVVTLRMPETLHRHLIAAGSQRELSLNRYCLQVLLQGLPLSVYEELFNGRSLLEAKVLAQTLGRRLRIGAVDGQATIVTADYDPCRIDVEVTGDQVVKVLGVG